MVTIAPLHQHQTLNSQIGIHLKSDRHPSQIRNGLLSHYKPKLSFIQPITKLASKLNKRNI